jgi:hypothetical protein
MIEYIFGGLVVFGLLGAICFRILGHLKRREKARRVNACSRKAAD